MRSGRHSPWILRRLLLVFLPGHLILFALLSGIQAARLAEHRKIQLTTAAALLSEALMRQSDGLLIRGAYDGLCAHLAALTGARVIVFKPDGLVLGDSSFGSRRLDSLQSPETVMAMTGGSGYAERRSATGRLAFAAAAVRGPGGDVIGIVRLAREAPSLGAAALELLPFGLWSLLVLLGLLLLCTWLIGRRVDYSFERAMTTLRQLGDEPEHIGSVLPNRGSAVDVLSAAVAESAHRLVSRLAVYERERRHWQTLFANMADGVLVVTEDQQILDLNPAAGKALALPENGSYAGNSLLAVVRNADLNQFVSDLFAGARLQEREVILPSRAGERSPYHLSGVRFDPGTEHAQAALVVMRDVTRLRQLELARKDFLGNVSHELKTPITAIKGCAESLADGADPQQTARFLDIIVRQADRLTSIIDDMATLSRLDQEDHQLAKVFEVRDLRQTIEHAVQTCAATLQERNATTTINVGGRPYFANHRLLEQAFANLVANAAKYSPVGGVISIDLTASDEFLDITVSDQGPGIPAEHRERVFERFYRVDKARDRQGGGTGLGLAIVKHIVRIHDGTITVEAAVPHGARLRLRLPDRPTAPEAW